MNKKALVTGTTGQIGSYMCEYLLKKGYEVHGLNRRKSSDNFRNISHILNKIKLHEGDVTDTHCIYTLIDKEKYDEVYNLAAQSHVHTSFEEPQLTFEVNTIGVLNLLEAIRRFSNHTKMYQASTSEMFGSSLPPQNEDTIFHPRSPYGVAKLAAHWLVTNYHESYKLRVACGIMFNSESSRRGDNFVTKKITNWVNEYANHIHNVYSQNNSDLPVLELGNIDAKRDWSHAEDSVDAIYKICNQDLFFTGLLGHNNKWKSYSFGSGEAYKVRDFLKRVLELQFKCEFNKRFYFEGQEVNEILVDKIFGTTIMKVNPKFYRPAEVNFLHCDPALIKTELNWSPKYDLDHIILDMIDD